MKREKRYGLIGGILGLLIGIILVYLPNFLPSGNFSCGLEHLNVLEYILCKFDIIAQISCGECINDFEVLIYFITRPLYGLIIGILTGYLISKFKK